MTPFTSKTILLGVTGSIAAYKAADLASKLAQAGARVEVTLTHAATRFVSPLTFQSVTGRRAHVNADLWSDQGHVLHVGLAQSADVLVIAPATANTLAKLAHGMADDLLSVTALAARCPMLVAPAMDGGMFEHPATQVNLKLLKDRGVQVLGPAEGHLASGLTSVGRMLEPAELFGHIRLALGRSGPLAGRRVVVTAGGTQEPIDPVRVIANRSSGKQGFALAQAALDRGAEVILVAGPVALPTPLGAQRVDVATAQEMAQAVLQACVEADALLMAAAVADFRPAEVARSKIKKNAAPHPIALELTPDILSAVAERRAAGGRPRVVVGFAAESGDLVPNARAKLDAKRLSFVVANDISSTDAGFAADTNRVALVDAQGVEYLPLMTKIEVAEAVIERAVKLLLDN